MRGFKSLYPLLDLNTVGKEIGRFCYANSKTYDIIDTVLFGSVARNSSTPNDIDIMLIHNNRAFEKIQGLHGKDGCSGDIQRVGLLEDTLIEFGYPSLASRIADHPILVDAIGKNVVNLRYLHSDFFQDKDYAHMEVGRNKDRHFFENMFEDALIWDTHTQSFSIPMRDKYILPGDAYENRKIQALQRTRIRGTLHCKTF